MVWARFHALDNFPVFSEKPAPATVLSALRDKPAAVTIRSAGPCR